MARSESRIVAIVAPLAIIGLFCALELVPVVFPDGVSSSQPAAHEGLLIVPKEGWDRASFTSVETLRANERAAAGQPQSGAIQCIQPFDARLPLEQALAQSIPDSSGARALWVSFVAEERWPLIACRNRHREWSGYLYAVSVAIAEPIDCDPALFIANRRRCPRESAEDGRQPADLLDTNRI